MSPIESPSKGAFQTSTFVFATCCPDSNDWLKREVARAHPLFRLAFSRPGFVSWKVPTLASQLELQSLVATAAGWGVGQVREFAGVVTKVLELATTLQGACVHVYSVAQEDPGEAVASSEAALRSHFEERGVQLPINTRARLQQPVIDVILLGPSEWFVGWHRQRADKFDGPGGVRAQPKDENSPSRAYSKVAELLSLGELSVRAGNTVVELGSAPGGGTLFLLKHGARVWAIDPAPLAPEVVAFAGTRGDVLTQLQLAAGDVSRQQLPKRVDYLVSDVNLAPTVSLRYLERLCALVGGPKRGILVNFKINDQKAEAMLSTVISNTRALGQRWGLTQLRVAQLPSHRKEIGLVLRRDQAT
jgi:23S rRNA (cytidine2498-2'-O)-methyltransferase